MITEIFIQDSDCRDKSKLLAKLVKIENNACVISGDFRLDYFENLSMSEVYLFAIITSELEKLQNTTVFDCEHMKVSMFDKYTGTYDFKTYDDLVKSLKILLKHDYLYSLIVNYLQIEDFQEYYFPSFYSLEKATRFINNDFKKEDGKQ